MGTVGTVGTVVHVPDRHFFPMPSRDGEGCRQARREVLEGRTDEPRAALRQLGPLEGSCRAQCRR